MDRNRKKLVGVLNQCLDVLKHVSNTKVYQANIKTKLANL